jgi:uncharacterized protein YukE
MEAEAMANKLKVDFDVFEETCTAYATSCENLYKVLHEINQAMGTLQASKWRSQASDTYFMTYSIEWMKNYTDHIKSIQFISGALQMAMGEYAGLYDAIPRLAEGMGDGFSSGHGYLPPRGNGTGPSL